MNIQWVREVKQLLPNAAPCGAAGGCVPVSRRRVQGVTESYGVAERGMCRGCVGVVHGCGACTVEVGGW